MLCINCAFWKPLKCAVVNCRMNIWNCDPIILRKTAVKFYFQLYFSLGSDQWQVLYLNRPLSEALWSFFCKSRRTQSIFAWASDQSCIMVKAYITNPVWMSLWAFLKCSKYEIPISTPMRHLVYSRVFSELHCAVLRKSLCYVMSDYFKSMSVS